MSVPPEEIRAAQRAKAALLARYGSRRWFRGVGISPSHGRLALRLSVGGEDPSEPLPEREDGIPVFVIRVGTFETR
jgi:hypothetical protein